ncbi:MAG TPA: hypothetical protein VFM18_16540 [Methanosarcina sp.]|nr:hypothetical protein [Methanosarcina sp.]
MANFPIPSDPEQKKQIMDCVREVSASLTRVEAERDLIKEAIKKLSEDTQIPKKILNKFAKAYHKSNFATVVGESEEFEELTLALQPKALDSVSDEN